MSSTASFDSVNVAVVRAAVGVHSPLQAAARLALERFAEARQAALALPAGAGQLLAGRRTVVVVTVGAVVVGATVVVVVVGTTVEDAALAMTSAAPKG